MCRITLGEADEQTGQCEEAGENSYRSSVVRTLAGLAAYPMALDRRLLFNRPVQGDCVIASRIRRSSAGPKDAHCRVPRLPIGSAMQTPELSGVTVVGAGAFNPAIVHPSWLAEKGLIPKDLSDAALREGNDQHQVVVSARLTSFVADWLTVQITQSKAVISTVDQGREVDLRDFAQGLFELLPETPVDAVGINSDSHYRARGETEWHAFGDKFLPKDYWEPLFAGDGWKTRDDGKRVGLRTVTIEVHRDDASVPGYVRVELAPSVRATPFGVYVGMNAHFHLSRPDKRGNAADAARILDARWEETRALESHILATISQSI